MSSKLVPSAGSAHRFLLGLGCGLFALLALAACGKKGPPLPPLRYVPATTQDFQVSQRGHELVFRLTYPSRSTDGLQLPDLARVELWGTGRPVTVGQEGSPAATPDPLDPRQFSLTAELELALAGRDLSESVHGNRLVFHTPAPETAAGTAEARFYAIRSVVSERDLSEYSNQAVIVPQTPPPAPNGVEAGAQKDGIEVRWEAPAEASGETAGAAEPVGFNLYRRASPGRSWGDPLYTAGPGERSWTDRSARFGETYTYGVTSVVMRQPLIESAPRETAEIAYRDLFAPPPPRGLVALGETGRVRLVWEADEVPDLAGFHVERRRDGGEWQRLTEAPVTGQEYVDRDLPTGGVLTYRVRSVDREGNESEPAAEATATVR